MSMLPTMEPTSTAPRSRRRDEGGSSLVEFAFIILLLSTLLLGIVVFGIILSKRQVLTQATAEGARAAVPYQYQPADTSNLKNAARTQVNKSLQVMDRTCGDGSTTCTFVVYACGGSTSTPPTGTGGRDCIEVSVALAVKGSKPLAPSISLINPFLPSTMSSKFTATLANPT